MPAKGSNTGSELLLALRRGPGAPPLGEQVQSGIRDAVRDGRLRSGQRLPPTRTLAEDLGVSRRLIVGAFEQLCAEGWLQARVGAGTYVRRQLPQPARAPLRAPAKRPQPGPRLDFFAGHPDLGFFPRSAWARATRQAIAELPDSALGYGDPQGLHELRSQLCELLARSRGVLCEPEQIVICQGAVQALNLLVRASSATADEPVRIAIEDPYLPTHRQLLQYAGAEVVPVPVDRLGVHDEAIINAEVKLALITPAHQCPTGVVLSAGRRAALARWAQENRTLIIEDDYDAEYRYDRSPVRAMQALAPDQIAYLGSASKTLAPGIRLAWLVVPHEHLDAILLAKRYSDICSPIIEQAALARMIGSGAYETHVRAARRRQRGHRDALLEALATHLPDARIEGVAAGLHAVVRLPRPFVTDLLTDAATARDLKVYPLSLWRADPPPETTAIVLGYGHLTPAMIGEGIRLLAEALAEIRG